VKRKDGVIIQKPQERGDPFGGKAGQRLCKSARRSAQRTNARVARISKKASPHEKGKALRPLCDPTTVERVGGKGKDTKKWENEKGLRSTIWGLKKKKKGSLSMTKGGCGYEISLNFDTGKVFTNAKRRVQFALNRGKRERAATPSETTQILGKTEELQRSCVKKTKSDESKPAGGEMMKKEETLR